MTFPSSGRLAFKLVKFTVQRSGWAGLRSNQQNEPQAMIAEPNRTSRTGWRREGGFELPDPSAPVSPWFATPVARR